MSDGHSIRPFHPIPDFEGYQINADGIIQSCRNKGNCRKSILGDTWKTLAHKINRGGYPAVGLFHSNGKRYHRTIHRLVLETFVGPCPPGMECRHMNGIPADCRLENLRWGTREENVNDKFDHGHHHKGSRHGLAKLDEEKVLKIRHLRKLGMTIAELGEMFGVSDVAISCVCNRKTWTHV